MAWKVLCPVPRFFNPFVPNAPILYPLKTSENHVEKGGRKRVHWEQMGSCFLRYLKVLKNQRWRRKYWP